MNCQTFREECFELLLPRGDAARCTALATHRESCPSCASYLEELNETLTTLRPTIDVKAGVEFKEHVMNHIHSLEAESSKQNNTRPRHKIVWKLAPLTALILIITAVVLINDLVRKGGTPAFALEKVVEASRNVNFIHMKLEMTGPGKPSDLWAQFDGQGSLLKLRADIPDAPDSEDGPKVVIWQEDKAEVWLEKKNLVLIIREPEILAKLRMTVDDFDPRRLAENLTREQSKGRADLEVRNSPAGEGAVEVVITRGAENAREVYTIDTRTNLVTRVEATSTKDGKTAPLYRVEYLDYNNPPVPSVFEAGAPADAVRIDQTAQEVGMAKGDMSDNEIAIAIVRRFWEAVIAGDYDQAGKLMEGIPGDYLKDKLETDGIKFTRIVSIGEPRPHHLPDTKGLEVPCKIEVEKDGKTSVEDVVPGVRPVYNQPDRWDIFGGF